MRYLLPALAAAAVVAIGAVPAAAESTSKRPPARAKSHVSLHLSSHAVLDSDSLALRGMVRPRARRRVKIVVRGARPEVLTLATKRNGMFALRWRPPRVGSYRVRAYTVHSRRARAAASAARRLTAYDRAVASYYGPGLYGGALACGGTLQPGTLGVAHKTLPCGAKVKLRYRSRSLTVRVVDRGPYAAGRDFDLTEATKARLRFPDLGVLLVSRGG